MKGDFKLETLEFIPNQSTTENQMLFDKELITSIYEYAIDHLIVTLNALDFVIIENWEFIRKIKETEPGNDEKDWQALFPCFDIKDFPYIISSGYKLYSIINDTYYIYLDYLPTPPEDIL